jgi:protein-S-isoprenylcysteine O-methyltransferase Ste14
MKDPHNMVYRIRGILMAPPFLFFTFVFLGETERDWVIWPVGLAIFGVGVLIRVWAQVHLHYRLRVHKTLTTTGPYAYIRNPIYVANTTMLLGLTVLSELLWFLPAMLLWCMAVYALVVRREEAHLLGKYGKPYAEYLQNVPRWLPRVSERHDTRVQGGSFLWPSVVAELHCFLWLIPLVAKDVFSALH